MRIPTIWRERRNVWWEKWLARWFTKCHLDTYHFSHFANIFSHSRQFDNKCITGFTLLMILPISLIFDSARNLTRKFPYRPFWRFVKIPIAWWEGQNARWQKWLVRRFTKCYLYTSRFSHFANIFSHSCQFDDKCIASWLYRCRLSTNYLPGWASFPGYLHFDWK